MSRQGPRWQSAPDTLRLADRDLHVWRLSLVPSAAAIQELLRLLSLDERMRADRYHFDGDRSAFVIRRAVLRLLAGMYTNREPASLGFDYNEYGKPRLDDESNRQNLRFNLSFSRNCALIAFSCEEVGVDIEVVEPGIEHRGISQRYFSRREIESLRALPEQEQLAAFYRCWTRKEAWIKACGHGLSIPLESFSVSIEARAAALLESREDHPVTTSSWSMHDLSAESEYAAAVAVRGYAQPPRLYDWSEKHWRLHGMRMD